DRTPPHDRSHSAAAECPAGDAGCEPSYGSDSFRKSGSGVRDPVARTTGLPDYRPTGLPDYRTTGCRQRLVAIQANARLVINGHQLEVRAFGHGLDCLWSFTAPPVWMEHDVR